MATVFYTVTGTPADLVSELSLTSGTSYLIQNVGKSRVWLAELASAPDASSTDGHLMIGDYKYDCLEIETSATPMYVWTDGAGITSRIAITEAS